jgi:hypothetical protein
MNLQNMLKYIKYVSSYESLKSRSRNDVQVESTVETVTFGIEPNWITDRRKTTIYDSDST